MRSLLLVVVLAAAALGAAPPAAAERVAPVALQVVDKPPPALVAPLSPAPSARPSRQDDPLDGAAPASLAPEPPRRPALSALQLPAARARSRALPGRRAHAPRGPPLRVS